MPIEEIDLLAAPEAPGAHHQETDQRDQRHPHNGQPPVEDRIAVEEMHDGGKHARRRRNRHADKILSARTARILGTGLWLILKRASRPAPHIRKRKQINAPNCTTAAKQSDIASGQHAEAPGKSQDARCNAESDDVGQRIQFLAKLAGSVRHARNAPVERVKGDRETDRQRRLVKVVRRRRRPLQALRDSEVTGGNVARGKYRGRMYMPRRNRCERPPAGLKPISPAMLPSAASSRLQAETPRAPMPRPAPAHPWPQLPSRLPAGSRPPANRT